MTEVNIEAVESARAIIDSMARETLSAATYSVRAWIPNASDAEVAALLAERVLRIAGVDVREPNP